MIAQLINKEIYVLMNELGKCIYFSQILDIDDVPSA